MTEEGVGEELIEPEWLWSGEETMHPLWIIRRLTRDQLRTDGTASMHSNGDEFNTHFVDKVFSVVSVGAMGSESLSSTFQIVVPILTNARAMVSGEEFIHESRSRINKVKRKENWRDDVLKTKKNDKKVPKVTVKSNSMEI